MTIEKLEQMTAPPLKPNVHQRILGIMSELDYIAKGDKTVNGSYRFVSHDSVAAKVHPLLVKYGVTVVPTVEELTQDGNRTIAKMIMTFVNVDLPQDNFSIRTIGYGIDGGGTNKEGKAVPIGDKGPGKAVSYAYKYGLLKTFCLETGEDPDNDANAAYEPAKCQEFDSMLQDRGFNVWDTEKIRIFVEMRAQDLACHVEDLKREACKRMDAFIDAFRKWETKK